MCVQREQRWFASCVPALHDVIKPSSHIKCWENSLRMLTNFLEVTSHDNNFFFQITFSLFRQLVWANDIFCRVGAMNNQHLNRLFTSLVFRCLFPYHLLGKWGAKQIIYYSDHHLNNSLLFRFQSNNRPFDDQTTFDHSNTVTIWIPD